MIGWLKLISSLALKLRTSLWVYEMDLYIPDLSSHWLHTEITVLGDSRLRVTAPWLWKQF